MLVSVGFFAFAASPVGAREPARADAYRDADALYFARDQEGNLQRGIGHLEEILKGNPEEGGARWRLCRALARRGEARPRKSDRLADYDAARTQCGKAVALSPDSADAHFWLGVAMGRWGEARGVLKAMFLIKPIRREMEATLKLDPGHGGAHRVLGEMLWQIPAFAGGDKKKALAEFEAAVRLSPNHSANYQPLAEAYLRFGRRDEAIRALNAVAAIRDPADPAEYPGDLADAKKMLAALSSK